MIIVEICKFWYKILEPYVFVYAEKLHYIIIIIEEISHKTSQMFEQFVSLASPVGCNQFYSLHFGILRQ